MSSRRGWTTGATASIDVWTGRATASIVAWIAGATASISGWTVGATASIVAWIARATAPAGAVTTAEPRPSPNPRPERTPSFGCARLARGMARRTTRFATNPRARIPVPWADPK